MSERHEACERLQAAAIEVFVARITSPNYSLDRAMAEVRELERLALAAGADAGVARLVRIGIAKRLQSAGRYERLEEVLDQLQTLIEYNNQISAYGTANYWNLRTLLALDRNQYFDAYVHATRFKASTEELLPNVRTRWSTVANDLMARVSMGLGDYKEAQRLLKTSEQAYQGDPRGRADWRINLATALSSSDDIFFARDQYEQAMEELKDANLPKVLARVQNNLALNYYLLGEFEDAKKLIELALKATPADEPVLIAERCVNAGWIAFGMGDRVKTAALFERALDLFNKHLPQHHPRVTEAMGYLARVELENGNAERAEVLIRNAESLEFERVCRELSLAGSSRDRISLVQEARVHPENIAWPGAVDTFLELAPRLGISEEGQYEVVLRWKGLVPRVDSLATAGAVTQMAEENQIRRLLAKEYFNRATDSEIENWKHSYVTSAAACVQLAESIRMMPL